ncbi:AraC family transcriptional regulator [Marinomonas sp. PE14-40]|uniref:AraC family transcriptional regulator n=1 Tax=Marinomonas sp. PE14-40 TaxID=3060621 RepID=UPI003F670B0B
MTLDNLVYPTANDPLGEVLHQLRLDGSLYCRSHLAGGWSLAMPVLPGKMMFHIINQGSCWLSLKGEAPQKLQQGALLLIPHGLGHTLSSDPDLEPTPFFDTGVKRVSERYETLDIFGEGEKTELICGVVGFDEFTGMQLVKSLPKMILLQSLEQGKANWLKASLELITHEARLLKPGGETIITHLADILVIQLIRHWLEESPEANQGWLGAIKDKHLGIALRAIHHEPEKNWTVDSLARECGMSRSGFSAHFTQTMGNTVKNYVTEWRMSIAHHKLKKNHEPLISLAEGLGYSSEAAFSRAFKRVMGFSPSQTKA